MNWDGRARDEGREGRNDDRGLADESGAETGGRRNESSFVATGIMTDTAPYVEEAREKRPARDLSAAAEAGVTRAMDAIVPLTDNEVGGLGVEHY